MSIARLSILIAAAGAVAASAFASLIVIRVNPFANLDDPKLKANECKVAVSVNRAALQGYREGIEAFGITAYVDPILHGAPDLRGRQFTNDRSETPSFRRALGDKFALYALILESRRRHDLRLASNDCSEAFRDAGFRFDPGKAERTRLVLAGHWIFLIRNRRPILQSDGWTAAQRNQLSCRFGLPGKVSVSGVGGGPDVLQQLNGNLRSGWTYSVMVEDVSKLSDSCD